MLAAVSGMAGVEAMCAAAQLPVTPVTITNPLNPFRTLAVTTLRHARRGC